MAFVTRAIVRFAHVDAAAIVFYPRYFEMLNGAVEEWFAEMGLGFPTLHVQRRIATPTVKLECEFMVPSALGDTLTIELLPQRVGRSSCHFDYHFSCDGQERLRGSVVLVCMDMQTQSSMPWPDQLRLGMQSAGAVNNA